MNHEPDKQNNSTIQIEREEPITVEKGAIYISEFMAQNSSTLAHEDGGFYDWIELTNSSNDSVDLSGYFLTDNRKKLTKSRLDSLTIAPHKTLLLWANGKPKNKNEVDFKLAKEKGEIFLVSPDSITIRSHVSYGWQASDHSQCYVEETWFYTYLPTPDEINSSKNLRVGFNQTVEITFEKRDGKIMASLSQPSDGEIMYTTDDSSPKGSNAKSYSQPFKVDSATVVRALQKSKTLIPRYESRAVYVDLNKHQIPVVLLVTAPENLWDDEIGILVEGNDRNFEKRTDDWIREGSIVYYENGEQVFSGAVDFKNYGAGTRVRPKKSMTIIADDPMPNHFFSSTEREEVDGFVLRACYSEASRFKNEAVNGVNQLMGSHTMMQEYHPVAFYINGNYWGIYNLSERKNKRFIQAHHGVTPTDILTSNGPRTEALKGSTDDFIQFIDSINSLTMNEPHIMDYVAENFDMTSLFDFWIHELYTNKSDRFNNKFWRSKKGDNKWRFVSYDFDIGFVWPDNPKTLKNFKDTKAVGINFFGRLMLNQEFSTAFFTRLCDYLNFGYTKSNMTNILEELDSLTKDEFKLDYARWSSEWKKCLDQGDNSKKKIIKFMEPRAQHFRDSIASAFGLTEKVTIENPAPEKGNLYVNGHLVKAPAVYFKGMEINLKAESKEGFSFKEWSSQVSEKKETLVLKKSGRIQVVFE